MCRIIGVLVKVIGAAVKGTTARTLCQLGDKLIGEETSKVHKKDKEMKKGNWLFSAGDIENWVF